MGRAQVAYVVCGVDLSGLGLDGGGGGFGFGFGCGKHVLLNIGEVERARTESDTGPVHEQISREQVQPPPHKAAWHGPTDAMVVGGGWSCLTTSPADNGRQAEAHRGFV